MLSGAVRSRRPPSPPPSHHPSAPRFPPKEGHLDADERRAAASLGYGPSRKHGHAPGGYNVTSGEWKLLLVLLVIASAVRLFRISKPDSVVFDEVHFGKFASRYIKTRYFVDVHPPLAKLLITLAAFVSGYDGNFDFGEIAKVYENTPYVAMRMLPATLGIATVPLAYLTLRGLDCRATTALLGSLLVIFDNALITQSRHILLDSPLVFFTALTIFIWTGFCNEDKHEPFTDRWWAWLTLTGLSLGAVVSSKWVGLFTIATVGLGTVRQLWTLLGDLRVSPRLWIKHICARALCLIIVPIIFYMLMFEIHFLILENSGEGDGFMSAEFQHTLGGRGMSDTFADNALGSKVAIRHVNTQGGYLHSHPHNYPGGSQQQQVTLYPHIDDNNDWRIINATQDNQPETDWMNYSELVYITSGSRVKLRHVSTEKNLHSHDFRPPVSEVEFQNEVSAYGLPGFAGDLNDDWVVEIEKSDKSDPESGRRVRTLRTQFRLRHALSGCYLFSHKVKLPTWGYEQQEVTCNKNAAKPNSLWVIESSTHPHLPPDAPKVNYRKIGFFDKFFELQRVMWQTNAGLTDRHMYDSRPSSWPRLRRGINFWVKDHRQIYLLGNPLIWFLSTAAIAGYVAVRALLILRAQRGYRDFENTKVVKYDMLCGFLFMGWGLHYFPFFLMSRQLFLHHYLPALYFAILLLCAVFDFMTSTLRPRWRLQIAAVLIICAVWNFSIFSPLVYGNTWTRQECEKAKWFRTWDFSCETFFDDYSQYKGAILATPQKSLAGSPPIATIGGEPAGRGAIVVQDDLGQAPNVPPQGEQTSVDAGKPEPGHDIFAQSPQGEVKSENKASLSPVEDSEPKAISSIGLTAHSDVLSKQDEIVSEKPAESASAVSQQQDGSPSPSYEASSPASSEVAKAKVQGPLDAEQAEADEVRQELFPDANT